MDAAPNAFQLNQSIFHDLVAWLRLHPPSADDLYSAAHTVHAVFRALPPLARHYVLRLVFLPADTPVPQPAFRAALRRRQRAEDRHDAAMRSLHALHILREPGAARAPVDVDAVTDPARHVADLPSHLVLHAGFAARLRDVLAAHVKEPLGGPLDDTMQPAADMDAFSATRLENILNFLVEADARVRPAAGILPALQGAGILEARVDGLNITSDGFHFLLKPSFPQLWVLLRALLPARYASHYAETLHLLFEMSAALPGRLYAVSRLSDAQVELLSDLHELGIVMLQKGGQTFRPTGVGVRLLGAGCHVGTDVSAADLPNIARTNGEMDVFVETNFRVYAYTTSDFQTNLLGLFSHLRFKLPGMVVAHITRTAVRNALVNGITAEQIIAYLNAHAHPRMKKGVIPPNVADEIRLWEAEQHRIRPRVGALLSDFQSDAAFERVLEFARDGEGMLWCSTERRQMFISEEGLPAVRQFIQRNGLQ